MKKLLFTLSVLFFAISSNAQQTEDDIYVGKSRTFGNYKETDIKNTKQIKGSPNVTGTVVKVGWCEEDCLTIWVKKDDGTILSVGTKDNGFTVPKDIVGKRIIIEGYESVKPIREKKTVKKESQDDIQFVATGVKFFDNKK
ncbi:MAG: hypothetical protein A3F91_12710 [Flavobacteria bacterium RIFCSPLOWO2_12_FULL_35_11]|nr:MAG: hypothetical protein A3F91_12710 [Flavobacteria bacterium RIFCSPLOWO2_12_FULL_35_11]